MSTELERELKLTIAEFEQRIEQLERHTDPRVTEYRVTHRWAGWVIRYWLATVDPLEVALSKLSAAEQHLFNRGTRDVALEIAHHLIEFVPNLNSVEVCNEVGNGVCIHRDWP